MGYAGNKEPQFIMPSAIAVKETAKVVTLMHVLVRYWIPNPESGLICVIIISNKRWEMSGEPPGVWRILIFTLGTRP